MAFPSLVDLPGELPSPDESNVDYYSAVVYANPSLEVVDLGPKGCGLVPLRDLAAGPSLALHSWARQKESGYIIESL